MSNPEATAKSSFGEDHHPLPAAQAQAALLIVESLIHSLLEAGVLTRDQAVAMLDSAADVKAESAEEAKEDQHTLRRSLALMQQMRNSIEGRRDPER